MSEMRDYRIWVALPDGTCVPAADFRLETDNRGRHQASGLRYHADWLSHPDRYAVNPVHAPLHAAPIEWRTREITAVLDEVLPGRWERAVQQRVWGKDRSVDDLRALLDVPRHSWRVGALEILPDGVEPPQLTSNILRADLEALAEEAERIHRHEAPEVRVLLQMQMGSSVGGARPKALFEDRGAWLAKFTREGDRFNHARVECACLRLAARAGIPVPESRMLQIGRFEALAVRRFDVTKAGGRRGLVSANALLKDEDTQVDRAHAAYEDIANQIRLHSTRPAEDLAQLYAQMLFNEAINNRDDHLKNFSFLTGRGEFHLSPAYDLVPSEEYGAYAQLDFNLTPNLPDIGTRESIQAGRAFSLAPGEAREINDALAQALAQVGEVMDEVELSQADRNYLLEHLPAPFRPRC